MESDGCASLQSRRDQGPFIGVSQSFEQPSYPPAFYFPDITPNSTAGTAAQGHFRTTEARNHSLGPSAPSSTKRCEICDQPSADTRFHEAQMQSHFEEDFVSRKQQNEELDYWLFQLKDENPNLPWARIAEEVHARFGETYQIATLQMRYKRYRLRMESELSEDDAALVRSLSYWERQKWDIIAGKLFEYRPEIKVSPTECHRRWLQIELKRLETYI